MTAIHISRTLESTTPHLPELLPLVGKRVEFTVREETESERAVSGAGSWVQAAERHESSDESPLERQFDALAREWKEATVYLSSVTEMATHPAYQRIVGMGVGAIPFIVKDLRREPEHWFWALKAITGADPVAPEDRGNIEKMAQAWLEWADKRGY